MSEKVRYHVERNIGKNYNRKTRHALYNNLKGQGESKETAPKPLTEQLRELGLDYDDYDEDYINKHYDNVTLIKKIETLMARKVLPPDEKSRYPKIQIKQLDTIQNNFSDLLNLLQEGLKITSDVLYGIRDIEIYQKQVKNLAKYKIKVDNAKDLSQDRYYNYKRERIEGFADLGYSLNNIDIQSIQSNTKDITFSNLKRLNTLLGRLVPIEIVLQDSYWKGLGNCYNMKDFQWNLVQQLTENGISIPDRQLRRFNDKNLINKKNLESLIQRGIRILDDEEIFEQIANPNGGEISNEDTKKIYQLNHPNEDPKKYGEYIDENFPEHAQIDFFTVYDKTEEYMQSKNKSS